MMKIGIMGKDAFGGRDPLRGGSSAEQRQGLRGQKQVWVGDQGMSSAGTACVSRPLGGPQESTMGVREEAQASSDAGMGNPPHLPYPLAG